MLLLITLSNSLDPDQAQQNDRPNLDPNCFDTDDCVCVIVFWKKLIFKKYTTKKHENYPACKEFYK